MTKQILLSQPSKFALVDDEDFERVNQYKWFFARGYAKRTNQIGTNGKTILMHRLIMNAPEGVEVDHIDGIGFHNEKHNLRLCSRIENSYNQKKQSRKTSSRFKGVSRHSKGNKWFARIGLGGVSIYLGLFGNEEDAAKAYDLKARELFGEFAKTNFD